ncbi:hypothetical protein ACHAPU_010133 [Fusarium lateritium]
MAMTYHRRHKYLLNSVINKEAHLQNGSNEYQGLGNLRDFVQCRDGRSQSGDQHLIDIEGGIRETIRATEKDAGDDIWGMYSEFVVSALVLRYMKDKYLVTKEKVAELSG